MECLEPREQLPPSPEEWLHGGIRGMQRPEMGAPPWNSHSNRGICLTLPDMCVPWVVCKCCMGPSWPGVSVHPQHPGGTWNMVDAPRQLLNTHGTHAETISAKEPVVAAQGGRGVARAPW